MARSSGSRGGRGNKGGDSGAGTSVGGPNTNTSTGGSDGRSSREKRRQEGAQALEGDLIKDIQAEMTLSEAVGKDLTGAVTGIEGAQKNDIGEASAAQKESLRRGAVAASFPGLDKLGVFGAVAAGVASANVDQTLSELGVDVGAKTSLSEMGKIGIDVAKEAIDIKSAVGFGASVKDLALGTLANPASAISGLVGRTVGKFGARFSAAPSFDTESSVASESGSVATSDGRTDGRTTGDVSVAGSAAPIRTEATGTEASLTDTGEVETRSRTSVDIRRRTRPAAFLGSNFELGTRELTG